MKIIVQTLRGHNELYKNHRQVHQDGIYSRWQFSFFYQMTTNRILTLFLKYSILIVSFDIYGLGRKRNRTRSCLREWYPGNAKTARECRSMRRNTALFRLVNTICWEPDLFMKCKEASVWYTVLLRRCPLAVWAGISDLLAPHCLVSLSLFLIMEVLHHGRDIKRR